MMTDPLDKFNRIAEKIMDLPDYDIRNRYINMAIRALNHDWERYKPIWQKKMDDLGRQICSVRPKAPI